MVEEVKKEGQTYYKCEACNMYYKDKKLAQECEDFCNKFKSCNLELIKHAVKI